MQNVGWQGVNRADSESAREIANLIRTSIPRKTLWPRLSVKAKLTGSFALVLGFLLAIVGLSIGREILLAGHSDAPGGSWPPWVSATLGLTVLALAVSMGLVYLANRDITHNIREVTRVAEAVSQGDVSQTAGIRTRDEFLELGQSLERMGSYLRELAAFAQKVAAGQLDARIEPRSQLDVLGRSLDNMAGNLRRLVDASAREEAARRIERSRRDLTACISHELRTPLGIIKGAITSMQADDVRLDQATVRDFLEMADSECDRLEGMIAGLIEMARLDLGSVQFNKREVDLEQLVRALVNDLAHRFESHAMTVASSTPIPSVIADPAAVEQTLLILLDNAAKYSPSGSPVSVEIQPDADGVNVSVSDSGPGIDESECEAIFGRFYRLPRRDAEGTAIPGAGMGLAIAKQLVEAHGGRIWVESRDGGGSSFHFKLPINRGGLIETA